MKHKSNDCNCFFVAIISVWLLFNMMAGLGGVINSNSSWGFCQRKWPSEVSYLRRAFPGYDLGCFLNKDPLKTDK